MKFPFKEAVFDGGVIIELLLLGDETDLFKAIINNNITPMTTSLAILEAEYILCRKIGRELAFEKVDNLIDSNYIKIELLENFLRDVSIIKCNNPIAIPDCATIALATKNKIPAVFAKKEEELKKPLEIKAFEIDLFFLEDFIN
ncbi:MAG: PIN domain-containing protein [Candidatus Helarchaeota archaeon]